MGLKGDNDILKTIIDAVNGISAYLREQARNVPDESNWGAMQLLPGPVELPTQDYRPAPPPVAEVVVPLPRQRPYDEGYMLPEPPVEWGRPASDSNTDSVFTIDLIVTNKEGEDFDPEQEITVYIRNDQSEVDITPREWDTDTILSFVRSEKDSLDVSGVLVGEGQHEPPNDQDTLYQQPWSTCASLAMVDGNGHPIGWYHYQYPDWEWYSPWGYDPPTWSPPF